MKRLLSVACAIITAAAAAVSPGAQAAQDISGTWQGVLKVPGITARRILKITTNKAGALSATMYSPDELDIPVPVKSIALHGDELTMRIDIDSGDWADYHRVYIAKISADGDTLTGAWSTPQGPSFPMNFRRAAPGTQWAIPPEPAIRYVTGANGIKLETFDWGGSGRPVVFLPGGGSNADIFQKCAHILTAHYHVYGINPRGFGASDKPAPTIANYFADRLGDDVVAALDALHIAHPVLIGHSIGGEELSDVATRFPHRAAALVYLDAAYSYAFYSPTAGAWTRSVLDADDLQQKMLALNAGLAGPKALEEVEAQDLPRIRDDIRLQQDSFDAFPAPPPGFDPGKDPAAAYVGAIVGGERKFTGAMHVPILAVFAEPMNPAMFRRDKSAKTVAAIKAIQNDKKAQISAFAHAQPTARIVDIRYADHFVFLSNQAEVLRALESFLAALPQ